MSGRARRLAEATGMPQLDRRAAGDGGPDLVVDGLRIPRRGSARLVVDGRAIQLTHLDRVLWPATGFTKAEMVAYYLAVADVLLPHLRDRPLTLGRFPGGVDGRGFAQTEVPGRPEWVRSVPLVLGTGAVRRFTLVDERAALAWLAQMGTVELHAFLAALPDLEQPRAVVFDLDPPPGGLLAAARVALRLRDRLRADGLAVFVKTSGSVGLHVLVPLAPGATYAATRAFAARVGGELAAALPDVVTDRMARAERGGRVLVDVRQNARRLTTVVPYSLRSAERPTVSLPVGWDELADAVGTGTAAPLRLEAADVVRRLAMIGDPLRDWTGQGGRLPPA